MSENGQITKAYKGLTQLSRKKQAKNGSEMGRSCGQTFVQKEYTDAEGEMKRYSPYYSPGKCESKSQWDNTSHLLEWL